MKFFILGILYLVIASEAFSPDKFLNEVPVCGSYKGYTKTFENALEFFEVFKKSDNVWKYESAGSCQQVSECKVYNPVCGVTKTHQFQTFENACLLKEAHKESGSIWKIFNKGICSATPLEAHTIPTTTALPFIDVETTTSVISKNPSSIISMVPWNGFFKYVRSLLEKVSPFTSEPEKVELLNNKEAIDNNQSPQQQVSAVNFIQKIEPRSSAALIHQQPETSASLNAPVKRYTPTFYPGSNIQPPPYPGSNIQPPPYPGSNIQTPSYDSSSIPIEQLIKILSNLQQPGHTVHAPAYQPYPVYMQPIITPIHSQPPPPVSCYSTTTVPTTTTTASTTTTTPTTTVPTQPTESIFNGPVYDGKFNYEPKDNTVNFGKFRIIIPGPSNTTCSQSNAATTTPNPSVTPPNTAINQTYYPQSGYTNQYSSPDTQSVQAMLAELASIFH